MNKFSFFWAGMLLCTGTLAQTVTVKSQSETVKSEKVEGYGTELAGKKEEVQSAWQKYLKDIGKVKQGSGQVTITEPVFNGLVFSKGLIYGLIQNDGDKTSVWLGVKPDEWDSKDVDRVNNELEKAVHQFGIKYYRDKIQAQIDDAQEAFDAVEKQKQRLVNQSKDLAVNLLNNEQQKIQLEKSIETNKFENAVLHVKIEKNKKAQDSLAQAGAQIQKIKLMHQDRQRKVN
jgi:hypothetical protein